MAPQAFYQARARIAISASSLVGVQGYLTSWYWQRSLAAREEVPLLAALTQRCCMNSSKLFVGNEGAYRNAHYYGLRRDRLATSSTTSTKPRLLPGSYYGSHAKPNPWQSGLVNEFPAAPPCPNALVWSSVTPLTSVGKRVRFNATSFGSAFPAGSARPLLAPLDLGAFACSKADHHSHATEGVAREEPLLSDKDCERRALSAQAMFSGGLSEAPQRAPSSSPVSLDTPQFRKRAPSHSLEHGQERAQMDPPILYRASTARPQEIDPQQGQRGVRDTHVRGMHVQSTPSENATGGSWAFRGAEADVVRWGSPLKLPPTRSSVAAEAFERFHWGHHRAPGVPSVVERHARVRFAALGGLEPDTDLPAPRLTKVVSHHALWHPSQSGDRLASRSGDLASRSGDLAGLTEVPVGEGGGHTRDEGLVRVDSDTVGRAESGREGAAVQGGASGDSFDGVADGRVQDGRMSGEGGRALDSAGPQAGESPLEGLRLGTDGLLVKAGGQNDAGVKAKATGAREGVSGSEGTYERLGGKRAGVADLGGSVADTRRALNETTPVGSDLAFFESVQSAGKAEKRDLQRVEAVSVGNRDENRTQSVEPTQSSPLSPLLDECYHGGEGSRRQGTGRVQRQIGKEVWKRRAGHPVDRGRGRRIVQIPARRDAQDAGGTSQWGADFGGWWEVGGVSRRAKVAESSRKLAESPRALSWATLMAPVSKVRDVPRPPQMLSWTELMQQVETPAETEKHSTSGPEAAPVTETGTSERTEGAVSKVSGAGVNAVEADASQGTVESTESKAVEPLVDGKFEAEGGRALREVSRSFEGPVPSQVAVVAPTVGDVLRVAGFRTEETGTGKPEIATVARSDETRHAVEAAAKIPIAEVGNSSESSMEDLSKAVDVAGGEAVEATRAPSEPVGLSPAVARLMSDGEAMSVREWEQLRGKLKEAQGKGEGLRSERSGILETGVRKAGEMRGGGFVSEGIGKAEVRQGREGDGQGDAVLRGAKVEEVGPEAAVSMERSRKALEHLPPLTRENMHEGRQTAVQGLLKADKAVEDAMPLVLRVAGPGQRAAGVTALEEGSAIEIGHESRLPFSARVEAEGASESFSEMLARLTAEGQVVSRKERKRLFNAWAKDKVEKPVQEREGTFVPAAPKTRDAVASEGAGLDSSREALSSEVSSASQHAAMAPKGGEVSDTLHAVAESRQSEVDQESQELERQELEAGADVARPEFVGESQELGVVAAENQEPSPMTAQPSEAPPERLQTSTAPEVAESVGDDPDSVVWHSSERAQRRRVSEGSFAALVARSQANGRALSVGEVEHLWEEWKVGKRRTRAVLIDKLGGVGSVTQVAQLVRKHGEDIMAKDAVQIVKALRDQNRPGSVHLFFQWCCYQPENYSGGGILSRYLVAQVIPAAAAIGRLADIERLLVANAAAQERGDVTAGEESVGEAAGGQSEWSADLDVTETSVHGASAGLRESVPRVSSEPVPADAILSGSDPASECFLADVFVCNALLEAYVEGGRWQEALGFFDKMGSPGKDLPEHTSRKGESDRGQNGDAAATEGDVVTGLDEQATDVGPTREGEEESATIAGIVREDYGWLEETFQEWLHHDQNRRGGLKHWKDGLVLRLPRGLSGLAQAAPPNVFSYNLAMRACLRGNLELAHVWALRERMEREGVVPDRVSYNLTIAACCKLPEGSAHFNARARGEDVLSLIDEMQTRRISPNVYTYTGAIVAWARANQAVSLALKRADPSVMVSILNRAMEDGQEPNVVTYGALIHGFAQMGELDNAELAFQDLLESGIPPNAAVLLALLAGCEVAGDFERARQWVERLERDGLHCSEETRIRLLSVRVHTGGAEEVVESWEVLRKETGSMLAGMRTLSRELVGGQSTGEDVTPETGEEPSFVVLDRAEAPLAGTNQSSIHTDSQSTRSLTPSVGGTGKDTDKPGAVRPLSPGLSDKESGRVSRAPLSGGNFARDSPENDVALYKILVQALGKSGREEEIAPVLEEMARGGCLPDAVLCNIILDTCARVSDWAITDAIVEALGAIAHAAGQQESSMNSTENGSLVDGIFASGQPDGGSDKDGEETGSAAVPHRHAAGGNRHPLPASFLSTTTELLTAGLTDADVKSRARKLMSVLSARGDSPETVLAFFSTLCDALWSFGWEKRVSLIAGALLGSGFRRGFKDRRPLSKANDKEWILDVRRLGKGAGQAVMFLWLQRVRGEFEAGESPPGRITIVTGHAGHRWAKGELRTVIGEQLEALESPLQPRSERNPGMFTGFGWEVREWLTEEGMDAKLALSDGADQGTEEEEQEVGVEEAF